VQFQARRDDWQYQGRNLNFIKHLLAVVGKFIMKVAGKA
jgi:hypothetical protein